MRPGMKMIGFGVDKYTIMPALATLECNQNRSALGKCCLAARLLIIITQLLPPSFNGTIRLADQLKLSSSVSGAPLEMRRT